MLSTLFSMFTMLLFMYGFLFSKEKDVLALGTNLQLFTDS